MWPLIAIIDKERGRERAREEGEKDGGRGKEERMVLFFLDSSKAYDKIDHWQLFNKLLNIHVPVFIVNILVYWYSRQETFIRLIQQNF